MRKPLALAAALAATAALAVPALAATKRISVGDYYFARHGTAPTVTVARGTTVTWVWKGRVRHNVVVRSGPVRFRSKVQARGTYSRRLTRAGVYRIVCTLHPGMEMRLRVR